MAEKKDIGKYFEEKMKDSTKSPNKTVWHKITQSLDELPEKKNSKRPYWLAVLGLPLLLGFFLWNNVSKEENINLQTSEIKQSEEFLTEPSNTENSGEDYKSTSRDFLNSKNSPEIEELSDLNLNSVNEEHSPANTSKVVINKKDNINKKKSSTKTVKIDETFTVTKNYHYYNSENEEEWTTTDKTKIDNLLTQPKEGIDSNALKSRDSLIE